MVKLLIHFAELKCHLEVQRVYFKLIKIIVEFIKCLGEVDFGGKIAVVFISFGLFKGFANYFY